MIIQIHVILPNFIWHQLSGVMMTSSHNQTIFPQGVNPVPPYNQAAVGSRIIASNLSFLASSSSSSYYDLDKHSTMNGFILTTIRHMRAFSKDDF